MRYKNDQCHIEVLGDLLKITLSEGVSTTLVPVTEILDLLRASGYTYADIPCPHVDGGGACNCRQCKTKCGAV